MALGDGEIWNEATPDNDTNLSDGDNHQRHIQVAVRKRLDKEHIWPSSQTATGQAGEHTFISFQATTVPSALLAGTTAGAMSVVSSGAGYEHYISTISAGTTAGNDVQVTFVGGLNIGVGAMASQTAGDMFYAAGATSVSRLAIAATSVLYPIAGTAPGWVSRATYDGGIVVVGAITTGTWAGTALTAAAIGDAQILSTQVAGAAITAGHVTGVMGAWEAAAGASGQATGDSLLTVYGSATNAFTIRGFSDAGTPASTQRSEDGESVTGGNGKAGFTMPVKKDHYWLISTSGATTALTVSLLPVGTA